MQGRAIRPPYANMADLPNVRAGASCAPSVASAFSAQFEGAKALLDAASLEGGRKIQGADNSQVLSFTVRSSWPR